LLCVEQINSTEKLVMLLNVYKKKIRLKLIFLAPFNIKSTDFNVVFILYVVLNNVQALG